MMLVRVGKINLSTLPGAPKILQCQSGEAFNNIFFLSCIEEVGEKLALSLRVYTKTIKEKDKPLLDIEIIDKILVEDFIKDDQHELEEKIQMHTIIIGASDSEE
jgi:hypothetical protein